MFLKVSTRVVVDEFFGVVCTDQFETSAGDIVHLVEPENEPAAEGGG